MKGFGNNYKTKKKSKDRKANSLQKDKLISNALLLHSKGNIKGFQAKMTDADEKEYGNIKYSNIYRCKSSSTIIITIKYFNYANTK